MDTEPAASVIIPNFNGRRFLPALLTSLANQSRGDFEVVVVVDASTDDSVDYVRSNWPDVREHANPRNIGFAGTVNAGIRLSTAPFVAQLNNDTHVDRDWFHEGMSAFDAATRRDMAVELIGRWPGNPWLAPILRELMSSCQATSAQSRSLQVA